jgi:hypothetical protein
MNTNELTGRELAVACARAMGWTVNKWDAWYDTEGHHSGTVEPEIDPREMLAWLHERGAVEINSDKSSASAWLWVAPARKPTVCVRGSNITEALQRLVVAVAQRCSKETP